MTHPMQPIPHHRSRVRLSLGSLPLVTRLETQVLATPLAMLLVVTGCGGDGDSASQVDPEVGTTSSQPAAPVDGPTISGDSSRGTFAIAITPRGGPMPTNEPFDVILEVTKPATGAPFTELDAITLDARMPAHDHGMTRDVELVATGMPGQYAADGLLFHMIGHWEFHVDVTRGPRMERAQVSTRLEF